MSESNITLDSRDEAVLLFGSRDLFLKEIRSALGMQQLAGRGDHVLLKGSDDQIDLAQRVFAQLRAVLRQQGSLTIEDVKSTRSARWPWLSPRSSMKVHRSCTVT